MSRNISLVVGVETYRDPKITAVDYAAADAKAVAVALNGIGFAAEDQMVLINEQATQGEVRYHSRLLLRSATKSDTVFLFFSGHGVSHGKQGHLVVEDSRANDLVTTTVSLESILSEIDKSQSQRIALFLDCCHAGLKFPTGERSILNTMTPQEIEDFFRDSSYRVAFSSCRADEKSYSSHHYRHGIWTYHLLQALTGKVPELLEKDRYLRAGQLQDYLAKEVPLSVRATFTERRPQNPILFGSLDRNFLIGDLDPVLPKPQVGDAVLNAGLKKAEFKQVTHGRVRDLPGFSRTRKHFVPEEHSEAAAGFIVSAGHELIEEEAKAWHKRIQSAFGYRRRENELQTGGDGAGIRTKDFSLSLSLDQHATDPAKYTITLLVDDFDPSIVLTDEFNGVFADAFSSLKLTGIGKQDVLKLIDRIEEAELPGVSITYPPEDPTYVCIRFKGHKADFVVGANWLKVKLGSASPGEFVEELRNVQALELHGKTTVASLLVK